MIVSALAGNCSLHQKKLFAKTSDKKVLCGATERRKSSLPKKTSKILLTVSSSTDIHVVQCSQIVTPIQCWTSALIITRHQQVGVIRWLHKLVSSLAALYYIVRVQITQDKQKNWHNFAVITRSVVCRWYTWLLILKHYKFNQQKLWGVSFTNIMPKHMQGWTAYDRRSSPSLKLWPVLLVWSSPLPWC